MTGFAEILAGSRPVDCGFGVEIPESWHQGRTAYGGLSSALVLAAAQQVGGAGLPPLRSAQLAMMAPVTGAVEVTARIERQGRNATWLSAHIHGENGLAFSANLAFMGPATSAIHINDRPPPAGYVPAQDGRDITYTGFTPAFLVNHLEARYAVPPAGEKRPEICRWVRLADRAPIDPMVELMLIGDGLPPGVMPMLHAAVPVSTMHWQVNLLTPAPVTTDGWWLLRSTGDYAEQGCSSQRMAIWNSRGDPVMAGMQSIALFG